MCGEADFEPDHLRPSRVHFKMQPKAVTRFSSMLGPEYVLQRWSTGSAARESCLPLKEGFAKKCKTLRKLNHLNLSRSKLLGRCIFCLRRNQAAVCGFVCSLNSVNSRICTRTVKRDHFSPRFSTKRSCGRRPERTQTSQDIRVGPGPASAGAAYATVTSFTIDPSGRWGGRGSLCRSSGAVNKTDPRTYSV